MSKRAEIIAKSGGVISASGSFLLVLFVTSLLAFPVLKECVSDKDAAEKPAQAKVKDCSFSSTAPHPFQSFISPQFLASSLLVIAGGIVMIRFSRWYEFRKPNPIED